MIHRTLGTSGIEVSAIGLGTMGLGGRYERDETSAEPGIRLLRRAIDHGITFFDTAEVYAAGLSEEILGRAVAGVRDKVVIATKYAPGHCDRNSLRRAAEGSLARLGTDTIDLYQMHWPNAAVPREETCEALADLVGRGCVRAVGLGNITVTETRKIRDLLPAGFPLVSMQQEYSLLERFVEARLLPYCRDAGLSLIAYSPLAQGRLAGREGGDDVLAQVARRYGLGAAQVALRWVVRQEGVIAIPMTSREDHLDAILAALSADLDEADLDVLSRAFEADIRDIPVEAIEVVASHTGKAFTTLEDARRNTLNLSPSPDELAEELRDGDMLKPVKVRPKPDADGRFELFEGQLRYWAWYIAHDGRKPITAMVARG